MSLTKSVSLFAVQSAVDGCVVDCLARIQDGWSAADLESLTTALIEAASPCGAVEVEGSLSNKVPTREAAVSGFPERLPAEQGGSLVLHLRLLSLEHQTWQAAETDYEVQATQVPRQLSVNQKRNTARFPAFADFLLETFGYEALCAGRGVLDVAGGSGGLAFELAVRRQIPCIIVDPRPFRYTPTQQLVLEHRRRARLALEPWVLSSPLAASTYDRFHSRPVTQIGALFDSAAVLGSAPTEPSPSGVVGAATAAAATAGSSERASETAVELLAAARECSVLVGLHPDQALDHIVDVAIAMRRPFCVVPCCVFWKHGRNPQRTTPDGTPVRTYDQLCSYVAGRAPEVREAVLPGFHGLNRCFYWVPPP